MGGHLLAGFFRSRRFRDHRLRRVVAAGVVTLLVAAATLTGSTVMAPSPAGAATGTLVGDTALGPYVNTAYPGNSAAYSTVASASGQLTSLSLFVDSGTFLVSRLVLGVYAENGGGHPGVLLAQGSINSPVRGAWNTVGIPPVGIAAGTRYWLALLSPAGLGVLRYRDRCCGGEVSVRGGQSGSGLPPTWSTWSTFNGGPVSMFGSGTKGPIISSVASQTITDVTATVKWTTHVPATSQVKYGLTPAYGSVTPFDPTLVTNHAQTITGLSPNTTYNYRVVSKDSSGETTNSANFTFTTTAPASAVGSWAPPVNLPIVAIHTTLTGAGKVLMWDGWETPTPARVWDPVTQGSTTVTSGSGLFCAAQVHLADGRILVAGGHDHGAADTGIKDASIFDPATNAWTRVADMHFARWYPSATTLSDGRVLVLSGEVTPGVWVDTPEVYDPATNTWTVLSGVSTPQIHERLYPLSFMLPDGRVLVIAPSTGATYVLDVANQTWTSVGTAPLRNGSAAMYQPGKILFSGGGDVSLATNPAQRTAAILDMTAPTPSWQLVASMASARFLHPSVVLPNGQVLMLTGGARMALTTNSFVLTSELWDPASSTWTTLPAMDSGRAYHGTALLMPDARVLVAGGGRIGAPAPDNFTAQIYSPPYLFKGARPTITNAPASAAYGSTVTVQTPEAAGIASVALVRLGADTHTLDMDQRVLSLSFTKGPGTLAVEVPSSGATAPPGQYMLFILNGNGVPSVAKIFQVGGTGGLAVLSPDATSTEVDVETVDQSVPRISRPEKTPRPADRVYGTEAFPVAAASEKSSGLRSSRRATSDHIVLCRL